MKKRFLVVLLAAVAGTCLFAGCGAKDNKAYEKHVEPDVTIRRELPNARQDFDGIFRMPPERGIARPSPLPSPHRRNGIHLK